MMRPEAFFLLLLLSKFYNATQQPSVFTFLRTDTELPGPLMRFNFSLTSGIFEFEFKTFVKQALVLYQDDNGKSDHIQVTLQDGRLWFLFYASKNNEPGITGQFTSAKTYNDFKWHSVRIERNASITSFILDHGEERKNVKTRGYLSTFSSTFLIGGFSSDQRINDLSNPGAFFLYIHPMSKRGFFNACVRNVKYGETRANVEEITDEYIEYNKVTKGCHLNYCHKPDPICSNGGKCSIKNGSVSCECYWTGFEGPRCTERTLELYLDGSYKVGYEVSGISVKNETYSFRIKTTRKNAVLFWGKGPSDHNDFILIEINSSRINVVANFGSSNGPGPKYTVTSSVIISDGKWHTVHYKKTTKKIALEVDKEPPIIQSICKKCYKQMNYGAFSFLGEITSSRNDSKEIIVIQDFIWETPTKKVEFLTGLYKAYKSRNDGFKVLPGNKFPRFNKKLPSPTLKTMSNNPSRPHVSCPEGRCTTSRGTTQAATSSQVPRNQARSNENEDDSSITWIIVVTVVFSLLLCAAGVFFVRKWNQRYSGDFQVNRKPIGPAGTIVHYQDAAHKEKQRQMKL